MESTTPAVLVHSLHVKIGPKDGVEVYGIPPVLVGVAPKAGMRTSYLRAVLRDCETGKLLWRSEVFLRDLVWSNNMNPSMLKRLQPSIIRSSPCYPLGNGPLTTHMRWSEGVGSSMD
jgi:hypothetical protein